MRLSPTVVFVLLLGCHKTEQRELRERQPLAPPMQQAQQAYADRDPVVKTVARDDTGSSTSMIIRTGEASIEVDSVDRAVTKVQDLARSAGGYVGNSSIEQGSDNVRSATLSVEVPEERFEGILNGLAPIGRVESVSVNAQDVGEEYVDYQGREANARRTEERLVALLATRTGKLKDVLDVEQELERVRGDIEHDEGHLRYLKAHAAMSTLAVTVHEHSPVLAEAPGEHPIREAARQAWRNFIGLISFAVASLGLVLPLAILGLGAWVLVRRPLRRAKGDGTWVG
jgi:hypothetical protein